MRNWPRRLWDFDASRGDQISVQNIAFQTVTGEEKLDAPTFDERVRVVSEHWTGLLRYVALIRSLPARLLADSEPGEEAGLGRFRIARACCRLAGAANVALWRGQQRRATSPGISSVESPGLPAPGAATANSPVQRALSMRQQVVSTVKADPENAGQLVQNWLGEGGAS